MNMYSVVYTYGSYFVSFAFSSLLETSVWSLCLPFPYTHAHKICFCAAFNLSVYFSISHSHSPRCCVISILFSFCPDHTVFYPFFSLRNCPIFSPKYHWKFSCIGLNLKLRRFIQYTQTCKHTHAHHWAWNNFCANKYTKIKWRCKNDDEDNTSREKNLKPKIGQQEIGYVDGRNWKEAN